MQLFNDDKILLGMRNFLDDAALYKYILNCVWKELAKHSHDCDTCDDVHKIKIFLEKLCEDNEVKVRLDGH